MRDSLGQPNLSAEQRAVLESSEPHLMVQASAGSGKTSVLVERYMRAVESGLRPHEILTITFTRKAAAEMKKRILGRMREAGWLDLAQQAESGPIQTIASFCERILRENSLLANIDPQFEIVESSEDYIDSACSKILSNLRPDDSRLLVLLEQSFSGESVENPFPAMVANLRRITGSLRSSGLHREAFSAEYGTPGQVLRSWREKTLAATGLAKEIELDAMDFELQVAKRAPRTLGLPRRALGIDEERERAAVTWAWVQLALESWKEVDEALWADQMADFVAIEQLAVSLLQNNAEVRERVKHQFRMIMVDEAQDLSLLQHALIDAIDPEGLLLVGDVKQSIFTWRNANIEYFQHRVSRTTTLPLSKNWRSEAPIQQFVDRLFSRHWSNYEPMLATSTDWDSEEPELDWSCIEKWQIPEKELQYDALAKQILVRIEEGVDPGSIGVLVQHGKYGRELQKSLRKFGVACLVDAGAEWFYTQMEIRDMSNLMLTTCDPTDEFSLLAALRSPYVNLSLDAITELCRTGDTVAAFPNFEPKAREDQRRLQVFRAWLDPLRRVADRLPAWEVLSLIIERAFVAQMTVTLREGEQKLANIRKLLQIAMSKPELGPNEFAAHTKNMAAIKQEEGVAPPGDQQGKVQILTIHRAKGLEWDHVLVADTDYSPNKKVDFYVNSTLGMFVFGKETRSLYYQLLHSIEDLKRVDERDRLLYVALTRARKKLWIAQTKAAKQKTHSKLLLTVLGPKQSKTGYVLVNLCEE